MSATDILRAKLDMHGIEHFDGTETTLWGYEKTGAMTGVYRYSADETTGGYMQVSMLHVTPAQAIAATLGQRIAQRVIISDKSTDFATGRCECGACKGVIDPCDDWCRHCGSALVGPSD